MDAIKAEELVLQTLSSGCKHLGGILKADVIAISAPMMFGLDGLVKNEIENLNEEDDSPDRLAVVLETTGGYIEVVERIVSVFRKHYKEVVYIVPNYAYSAGTVLALSGDEIYMNYYSVVGPIDPQFQTENGRSVPGLGYIAKYNELLQKINSVSDDNVGSVRAEMSLLIKQFDQAQLFHIEQSIRHSQELVEAWLPVYKFRNWKKTTSGKKVTPEYKVERAKKIAKILGDAEHWHSHGRGITMSELGSEKIGLKVEDFGEDEALNANITHYHGLLSDFMQTTGMSAAIHTRLRMRRAA
ncbi:MAG: hypothetical protein V7672_09485 [Brevundimonas sp.]|uniref:SDH family Clp fold serine proteinase n=1 Tax=Brevundimonas sp. TaxID=1871086 RepID=UPI0030017832